MRKIIGLLILIVISMACSLSQQAGTSVVNTGASSTNTPFPTYPLSTQDTTVLFEENFTYEASNWWTGDEDGVKASISGGEFHYSMMNNNSLNWVTYGEKIFTDVVVRVDFRMTNGDIHDTGSSFVWRELDQGNFYFMEVSPDGFFKVGKYAKNTPVFINIPTQSRFLHTGDANNRVTIVSHGNTHDIYFNDRFEYSFTDNSLTSGKVGMGVFTSEESGVEVSFDGIAAYRYDPANDYTPARPDMTPTPVQAAITWKQLADFLTSDHTNWKAYDLEDYNCLDYAIDLVSNARNEHMKAWIVAVDFVGGDTGHAFVAFETSDRGTVYVEPQRDYTYSTLAKGNDLCDDWGLDACWGIVKDISFLGTCNHDGYCTDYTP